jgi:hypothetical protein
MEYYSAIKRMLIMSLYTGEGTGYGKMKQMKVYVYVYISIYVYMYIVGGFHYAVIIYI